MPQKAQTPKLSLVIGAPLGPGARHGLTKLRQSLQVREVAYDEVGAVETAIGDMLVVAGVSGSAVIDRLAADASIPLPTGAEALCIRRLSEQDAPTWLVAGSDDRGLMYALLDLADRVTWASDAADPFSEVRDISETPEVAERSLSIYTMQRAAFEERFHDPAYWSLYLDMLARNRFNTFALLFAYESAGYFAPPYPYFFDVPGFPDVHIVGTTPAMQAQGLASLNRLIAMVHERGLDFTLGIWDHIYRGGVQSGGVQEEREAALKWRVQGVTQENLMDYSVAALTELLRRVPSLDALQFRMHGESGLAEAEMDVFWDRIYDVIIAEAPELRFDARAKGFPDHLIDLALKKGVKIRICTKYWMEQMGLPFHPTHIHPNNQHDRRHGYADLLRYPQRYKLHWRLWNGGTNRVLLWGDPEYVRRFVDSTHLYDGEGFDVNEPLATKMAAHDHDARPFNLLTEPYRHYDYEFERYWHFFQLYGRLGYNPQTPPEIWGREFALRFGKAAGPHVAQGLHTASRILPRIVAYTYPYHLFPTTRGWVEKECMGDLPTYAAALPSDTQQFLSIAEEAENQLEGRDSAKIRPQASAAWFERASQTVLEQVALAEEAIEAERTPEFAATITDLKILAHLARYHARRVRAGVAWALFERSQDLNALDEAISFERQAITVWEQLVAAAGDVYADDLMMGLPSAGLSGHWRDELTVLRQSLVALEARRAAYTPPKIKGAPRIAHVPVRRQRPGESILIMATAAAAGELEHVRLCYGCNEDEAICMTMARAEGPEHRGLRWQATIPGYAVEPGLWYLIEAVDAAGRQTLLPTSGDRHPIHVVVTEDEAPPTVEHTPVTSAPTRNPVTIRANVHDPSGVRWVHLRYRNVNQLQDYRTLEMIPSGDAGEYIAVMSAAEIDPQWDLMYLIETMDVHGNGAICPDLEVAAPYVIIKLDRG